MGCCTTMRAFWQLTLNIDMLEPDPPDAVFFLGYYPALEHDEALDVIPAPADEDEPSNGETSIGCFLSKGRSGTLECHIPCPDPDYVAKVGSQNDIVFVRICKMAKPDKLVFSDEATFSFFRGEILVPIGIASFGIIAALVTSKSSLAETLAGLVLPIGALSVGWLAWVGLLAFISWGHRIGEKHSINHMFAGEIWECWQFSSSEWQSLVESECNLISPKDEGLKAYIGAVYSSIFGIIFAVILVAIGVFAVRDSDVKTMMYVVAVVVFFLFLGAGLLQPLFARYKADGYRRKTFRVTEPRVWFAPDGIYHEALGYTSLKELIQVTDRTRSNKFIQFTHAISTESSTDTLAIPFPVPSGYEERAGRLIRRYRQERLHS